MTIAMGLLGAAATVYAATIQVAKQMEKVVPMSSSSLLPDQPCRKKGIWSVRSPNSIKSA